MLKRQEDPLSLLTQKLCEHPLAPMESGKPNPEHVTILVSPKKVKGFDIPHVDPSFPLVAIVKTGCNDPAHNKELLEETPARETEMLFVADEYVAGRSSDLRGPYFRLAGNKNVPLLPMLPWYEWALRDYFLPPGWSLKGWVFTSPRGEKLPYIANFKAYANGDHHLDHGTIENTLADFGRSFGRVNLYVNELVKGGGRADDKRKKQQVLNRDDAISVMRNFIVPKDIESTARDTVYGYGGGNVDDAKTMRQALTAFFQYKLEAPISVFDQVYSWPK